MSLCNDLKRFRGHCSGNHLKRFEEGWLHVSGLHVLPHSGSGGTSLENLHAIVASVSHDDAPVAVKYDATAGFAELSVVRALAADDAKRDRRSRCSAALARVDCRFQQQCDLTARVVLLYTGVIFSAVRQL